MKLWKKAVLFYLGGAGYMGLEVLWRGWSHGSMFLAGGTCFLYLGWLEKKHIPLPVKLILGAAGITLVELITGLLANRDYQVWDYRHLPFQFRGQISLVFSLLWIPVSMAAMGLYGKLGGRLRAVGEKW